MSVTLSISASARSQTFECKQMQAPVNLPAGFFHRVWHRRLIHLYQSLEARQVLEALRQSAFSGKSPGIQCEASTAGNARRSGERALSEVTHSFPEALRRCGAPGGRRC